MYVDKALVGLAAVQTRSRLNRIHPLKENTFVLDFRATLGEFCLRKVYERLQAGSSEN